jgi:N-acetylneuraminic acid mutarotase
MRPAALLALVTIVGCSSASPVATGSPPSKPVVVANAPLARGYHHMFGTSYGVLLWGGETAPPRSGGVLLGDAWVYRRGTGWAAKATIGQRDAAAAYFDTAMGRLITFVDLQGRFEDASEDWTYDPSADAWQQMPVATRPDLFNPSGAYDAGSKRYILFTGDGHTWAYEFAKNTWKDMNPAVHPDGRYFPAMDYDPVVDRIVMFGGSIDDVGQTDTWTYDYDHNMWREMRPATFPTRRLHGTMVYEPASRKMILFGGEETQANNPLSDTWSYDLAANTWTQLTPKASPSARARQAMAFDAESNTIVMFGGGANPFRFTNDTWVYDPRENTWSLV